MRAAKDEGVNVGVQGGVSATVVQTENGKGKGKNPQKQSDKFKLTIVWVELLLELCLGHDNETVRRFVVERLMEDSVSNRNVWGRLSSGFAHSCILPKVLEHSWYLNQSSDTQEVRVKTFFASRGGVCTSSDAEEASKHPAAQNARKLLKAVRDLYPRFFVPLRVAVETLALAAENAGPQFQWTDEEFSYAMHLIEHEVRWIPRAARTHLIGVMLRGFCRMFQGVGSRVTAKDSPSVVDEGLLTAHTKFLRFLGAIPDECWSIDFVADKLGLRDESTGTPKESKAVCNHYTEIVLEFSLMGKSKISLPAGRPLLVGLGRALALDEHALGETQILSDVLKTGLEQPRFFEDGPLKSLYLFQRLRNSATLKDVNTEFIQLYIVERLQAFA